MRSSAPPGGCTATFLRHCQATPSVFSPLQHRQQRIVSLSRESLTVTAVTSAPPRDDGAMSSSQSKPLRVLALHGWRTSGRVLDWQYSSYASLAPKLSDLVEVTCIDAPHPARGPTMGGIENYVNGPYYEWWDAVKRPGSESESLYNGMPESIEYVLDYIKANGPFDGLMGFSQGGTMSAVLAALHQAGACAIEPAPPRFCLIFAGLLSRDYRHATLYDTPIECPAFIVYGENDPGARYTKKLASTFRNPHVISHPGGHIVPALKGSQLEELRSFLSSHQSSKL
mmetsp:Transcript_5132/g.12975  ORF Transcript_5132/g.12975 Transcript_5132/m.12975 type:complete len:284 (+) Transcript_5132:213-1064(+)|eukprot:jgi/Tetstr1/459574/TSEL_004939.t1